MIASLRLVNFKNFADETLRIGPFTVIVGANASGKSNIRDAFRFLHGIGRGYTLAEIMGGKHGVGGQREWEGIRGATDEIVRFGQPAFSLHVEIDKLTYSITVSADRETPGIFRVTREELKAASWRKIYTSHPGPSDPVHAQDNDTHLLLRMDKTGTQRKYGNRIAVRPDQPALTQIREHRRIVRPHKGYAERVVQVLANMRFLDLELNRMRQPAFPGQTILGDGGENLPTVLREICADAKRKKTLASWTRELTPMDVVDFDFPSDPVTGRVQLVIREANDRTVSAYSASDGTLRFLAMLAALLGKNPEGVYFFEEIDNGIHPNRLWLLLELIEKQTAKKGIQAITTTHSPDMLNLINDKTFENTSAVVRLEDTDDSIISAVDSLPNVKKLRNSQGLGRLHTSGWMEDMLAFAEGETRVGRTENESPPNSRRLPQRPVYFEAYFLAAL